MSTNAKSKPEYLLRSFSNYATLHIYFGNTIGPYTVVVYGPIPPGWGKISTKKLVTREQIDDLIDLMRSSDDYYVLKIIDSSGWFKTIDKVSE